MWSDRPEIRVALSFWLGAVLFTGCAASPEQKDSGAVAAEARAEAEVRLAEAADAGAEISDAEMLQLAIDSGYELSYRDGERIFCRREGVTGTRVRQRVVCLTAAELRTLKNDTRDYLDDVTRRQIPKQGN
jgi:hypothetical protein